MKPIKPADEVIFADERLEEEFLSLSEDNWLKKSLRRAIENFKNNVFCGEAIKKDLIPRIYIQKYRINNLMWYQLPNAWRLVYSAVMGQRKVIAMIIEYYTEQKQTAHFSVQSVSDKTGFSFVSPNPKQTAPFKVRYKSEGFGDAHKIIVGISQKIKQE